MSVLYRAKIESGKKPDCEKVGIHIEISLQVLREEIYRKLFLYI